MNDGIEEPKRRDNFSAEELEGGWVSWNLKDPSRFNAFIEPLSVRVEPDTPDGRPQARAGLPVKKAYPAFRFTWFLASPGLRDQLSLLTFAALRTDLIKAQGSDSLLRCRLAADAVD